MGWGTQEAGAQGVANSEQAIVFWRQDRGLIGNFLRSAIEKFHPSPASRQWAALLGNSSGVTLKLHSDATIFGGNAMKLLGSEGVKVHNLHVDFNAPGIAESTAANLSSSIGATYSYHLNMADPIGVVTTLNPAKQAIYGILGTITLARDHGRTNYSSSQFSQ